jgi:glycosyltransferase involved in cell wall biosynthesis
VNLGIVVQRYGADINGGAEQHARYIAERLARHARVEVITTCAVDYVTWRNELPAGVDEVNGVPVRRFPVRHERDPLAFGLLSQRVFERTHTVADELAWLEAEGPACPQMIQHAASGGFDYVFFFSYRYHHAWHGVRRLHDRAILVPTAERDPAMGLSLFPPIFRAARAIMYNSPEERAMIQAATRNEDVPGVVVGVGSDVPERTEAARFRRKFRLRRPFAIYVGRIDENKGCAELFDYFQRYAATFPHGLDLVLIGRAIIPIPDHPRIHHLGFLPDADKFDALAAADLLIMPSYFESLSMVALEAWALGRPVLANGRCDVLGGSASGAARDCTTRTTPSSWRRCTRWNRTARSTRCWGATAASSSASTTPGRSSSRSTSRCSIGCAPRTPRADGPARWRSCRAGGPAGVTTAAGRQCPRADPVGGGARRAPAGRRRPPMAEVGVSRPRVHQVLATLGYGDAIGHEVLGIQRVLREAGCDSEIFVETADPRLEDLTVDYREMVGAVTPDDVLIHHFSIGSRASRTAYALPGRMVLVYHNITPPEYFIGVHRDLVRLCFRGRRELTAYVNRCTLALGDSEYNRRELEEAGFADTGVLPVVPASPTSTCPRTAAWPPLRRRWTNVMFVGRVIPNKKIEDVIRAFHVYRTRHNPRARLLLVGSYGGFEKYLAMLHALIARLGTPDVHFLGHVSNEELTALYDVADLFLCASEHEGFCVPLIEAFYKRVPVLAYAATAVPATMDGGGVLFDTKDPFAVARLMEAMLDDTGIERRRRGVAGRRPRAPRSEGLCRHPPPVRGRRAAAAADGRPGGPLGLLGAVRAVRAPRGTAPVPPRALPRAAGSAGGGRLHTGRPGARA